MCFLFSLREEVNRDLSRPPPLSEKVPKRLQSASTLQFLFQMLVCKVKFFSSTPAECEKRFSSTAFIYLL